MNKKLQLNSKFEFNNNFFFISPLLHEYSFFDPRWRPGSSGPANIPKAAAQNRRRKSSKRLRRNFFAISGRSHLRAVTVFRLDGRAV